MMIDFIGIIGVFLVGIVLFAWGSMIPDKADVILEYNDKIVELGMERWNCGEDTQCQKLKTNSINTINLSLTSIEASQNMRNSLIGLGLLIDIGTVIGLFLRFR